MMFRQHWMVFRGFLLCIWRDWKALYALDGWMDGIGKDCIVLARSSTFIYPFEYSTISVFQNAMFPASYNFTSNCCIAVFRFPFFTYNHPGGR
jgi:hypothetical protein